MKLFILLWDSGIEKEILGVYEDEQLALHCMNKVIEGSNRFHIDDFSIREEVLQTW